METGKDIIVALEFGSSAIRGIAAHRLTDGNIEILDIEYEKTSSDTILRGVIFNIDKTSQAVNNIVTRMNTKLGARVVQVYVGIAGQSLHSVTNDVMHSQGSDMKISSEIVDRLMDDNWNTEYTNSTILDVVPQEYIVGGRAVNDPVGIQSEKLEGRFINIVARKTLKENIEKCLKLAGLQIVDIFISAQALGDALLNDSKKRSGCALIDFGASTTTVSVYSNNILRHLSVIPLGGDHITNDIITIFPMEKEEGEILKRKHGIANVPVDTDNPRKFEISNDRTITENELQDIIGARQEEIIVNAWKQIESLKDSLLSGIIITGGAALMKDMVEAIKTLTGMERVELAKSLITTANVAPNVQTPQGINIDTLIAMVMKSDVNCIEEITNNQELEEKYTPIEEENDTEEKKGDDKAHEDEEDKPKGPSAWQKLLKLVKDTLTED